MRPVRLFAVTFAFLVLAGSWDKLPGKGERGFFRLVNTAFAEILPVSKDELLAPGPLSELSVGPVNARVTVVEYASMSCGACAVFHKDVLARLKAKYLKTGGVRFIFREFPLDTASLGAAMLARCTGDSRTLKTIDVLFREQEVWARADNPGKALFAILKQVGLTEKRFDACLSDQSLLEKIQQTKEKAENSLGVRSTPTLFVEDRIIDQPLSFENLDAVIDSYLSGRRHAQ